MRKDGICTIRWDFISIYLNILDLIYICYDKNSTNKTDCVKKH